MAALTPNEKTEATVDTTVSLEPHLLERLNPLLELLPLNLRDLLAAELEHSEVHYSLLARIARWARSDDGKNRILAANLDTNSYHIVSLLAGTRTAPSSKPPLHIPPESPEARAQREWNDRKALTAITNSVLSIGCTAIAAWWAADKAQWRAEWKVLLALAVALVVGSSEAVLLLIWQTKSTGEVPGSTRSIRLVSCEKLGDAEAEHQVLEAPDTTSIPSDVHLRRRTVVCTLE